MLITDKKCLLPNLAGAFKVELAGPRKGMSLSVSCSTLETIKYSLNFFTLDSASHSGTDGSLKQRVLCRAVVG